MYECRLGVYYCVGAYDYSELTIVTDVQDVREQLSNESPQKGTCGLKLTLKINNCDSLVFVIPLLNKV
jgi:hypothetical protein